MRLVLVRHALPVTLQVETGRADPELSPTGHEQAARIAEVLAAEGVDAVYASPLRRAIQTAEPTAAAAGLSIQEEPGLVELDSRMATYSPEQIANPSDDLARAYLEGDWSQLSDESPEEFHTRVRGCLDGIVAAHRGQTAVAFTHGGVINAWLAAVTGAGHLPIRWFLADYGALNRFITTGSERTFIRSLNEGCSPWG